MLLIFLGSSAAVIGGAVGGSTVGVSLAIVCILYCRYRMKANTAHGDFSQPAENLTTSGAYGMYTVRESQQEAYAYATVGNAGSLSSSSPMTSNPAYSTTSQS